MFGHRRIGILLFVLGIITMSIGSVLAGSEGPVDPVDPDSADPAGATTGHHTGWVIGAVGVLLSLVGIVTSANARRAFF